MTAWGLSRLGGGKLQVKQCPQCPVSDGRPEKGGLSSLATSGSRLLSFEDLIGGREKLIRNGEAERLSGF